MRRICFQINSYIDSLINDVAKLSLLQKVLETVAKITNSQNTDVEAFYASPFDGLTAVNTCPFNVEIRLSHSSTWTTHPDNVQKLKDAIIEVLTNASELPSGIEFRILLLTGNDSIYGTGKTV